MSNFYVYIHKRLDNGLVFYVGKGKNNRAFSDKGRNKYWKNTVSKHGFVVEIVFENLTEDEAFQIEKDTILEFEYFNHPLTNMTRGGEGSSGFKWSQDQLKNHVKFKLKGVKHSEERIEKNRISQTGKKQSLETKIKRAKKLKEVGTVNDRNTYLFYCKDDIFIGTRKELCEYLNLDNTRKLRSLFWSKPNLTAFGWSVLRLNELLIFKEIQNGRTLRY